jgi:hypothetical protein
MTQETGEWVLVLLIVLGGLIVAAGIVLVVWPRLVLRFFDRIWAVLESSGLLRKPPLLKTPVIGGIGMIIIGGVLLVILITQGANALQ